jgi:YbgC/YbaW family acyl-CoA thioester hydrolase
MAVFEYQCRVRYFDTDQFQAAHHSRMYLWFEEARTELLRKLGRPYQEFENAGIFFPVREAVCRYRGLARFDMLLNVAIDRVDVRGASLRFDYRVTSAGAPIAAVRSCACRTNCARSSATASLNRNFFGDLERGGLATPHDHCHRPWNWVAPDGWEPPRSRGRPG